MALLDFKGFENVPSSPNPTQFPNYQLSTTSGFNRVAGQLGGFALGTSSGTRPVVFSDGNNYPTLIVGARIRLLSGFSSVPEVLVFYDGTTDQCTLVIGADGFLRLYRGTAAGTLIATGSTLLTPNAYYYIEVKITFHNSTGAYEVRLGGAVEFSGSGVDLCITANNYANRVEFPIGTNGVENLDDTYIEDDTGSAPHNDFLGPVRVETGLVTTDGSSTQFTPLSSTNASNVDDANGIADDDTSYNLSGTSGHIDLFNHGALTATPVTIFAAAVYTRARKDDVSFRQLRNKLKSGATTSNGVSLPMDTSYKYTRDQYIVDPNTAAAWTTSNVNATEIGYEHV